MQSRKERGLGSPLFVCNHVILVEITRNFRSKGFTMPEKNTMINGDKEA
ncbi:MAG: hypothetical protein DDT37_00437 [Firmicutes bacterium]|nr:hypothetical protein [candidate division NPL-UPA2 bacterium]